MPDLRSRLMPLRTRERRRPDVARPPVTPLRWVLGTAWRSLTLSVALVAIFALGLTIVYTIPDRPVVDNLLEAARQRSWGPDYPPDGVGGTHDRYTECIAAGSGIVAPGADVGPWDKARMTPRIGPCASIQVLQHIADGDTTAVWGRYLRYWNGYAVLTRPLLATVGLSGTRLVTGALLVLTIALAWSVVRHRAGALAASALVTPLLVASNVVESPLAFSHAVALTVAVLGLVLTATLARSARSALLVALTAGGLFVFSDLLTVPAAAWSLCVAGAGVAAWSAGLRPARLLGRVSAAAVGWGLGYSLVWAGKWVLAGTVAGFAEVYDQVAGIAAYRMAGERSGVVDPRWGRSTEVVFSYWQTTIATSTATWRCVLVLATISVAVAVVRHRLRGLVTAIVLAAPALVVPLWYELMKNHSQIHTFFVYRSIPAGLGVMLLGCVLAARRAPATPGGSEPQPPPPPGVAVHPQATPVGRVPGVSDPEDSDPGGGGTDQRS